jgi:tRNA threonylcarbamoyladenosine biosynthesis protein TsaB
MDVQQLSHLIHEPTIVCGELTEEQQKTIARKYRNVILASPARSIRRPALLAELAWKRWLAGEVDDPASLSPTYLPVGEPIPG